MDCTEIFLSLFRSPALGSRSRSFSPFRRVPCVKDFRAGVVFLTVFVNKLLKLKFSTIQTNRSLEIARVECEILDRVAWVPLSYKVFAFYSTDLIFKWFETNILYFSQNILHTESLISFFTPLTLTLTGLHLKVYKCKFPNAGWMLLCHFVNAYHSSSLFSLYLSFIFGCVFCFCFGFWSALCLASERERTCSTER